MLTKILRTIAANPVAYDIIQFLAGTPIIDRRIKSVLEAHVPAVARIVDFCGGTEHQLCLTAALPAVRILNFTRAIVASQVV